MAAKGHTDVKADYDDLEFIINASITQDCERFDPTVPLKKAKAVAMDVEKFVNSLPTQTLRTTEMEQFQQFSTPPHLAYAVAWAANLKPTDVVLEPSAGTGCLTSWAVNAGVRAIYANEIHPRRADILEQFKLTAVWREDALHIHNLIPEGVHPSVVLMNPPFSKNVKTGSKANSMVAALHVEAALKTLAPGGRLVTVLPGHYGIDSPNRPQYALDWWNGIFRQYTVQGCINVPGKLYRKYGTSYDVCIAVIDRLAPSDAAGTRQGTIVTVADLLDAMCPIRDRRAESQVPMRSGELFGVASFMSAFAPAQTDDKGELPEEASEQQVQVVNEPVDGGPLTEAVYEAYKPQRLRIVGAKPHPTPLVQSAAMASVLPPVPNYAPMLPQHLIDEGILSDAQLEAITYAGMAFTQWLEPESARVWDSALGDFADEREAVKFRRGFMVGDGTGVGKGREIAGIIMDDLNRRPGRGGVAVWVSKTNKLHRDACRDWKDLGGNPDEILKLSKYKPGEPIPQPIPGRRRILFVSYGLLKSGRTDPIKSRLKQIINWVGVMFDGVIAFDEAHAGKNGVEVKGDRGMSSMSDTAASMIELQRAIPKAKVLYCSATGATEVSNLAYAERLGLWGRGTPFPHKTDFIAAVNSGGVAAMELVARDMKQFGLYCARGLSFTGVDYERLEHTLTADQRDVYDTLCEGWQVILRNMEKALEMTASYYNASNSLVVDGKARGKVISAFWGAHQRFFNQVITAMQMPTVVKDIQKQLKAGNACVLQLVNTNEAVQERQLAKMLDDDDEDASLEDIDLTPRENILQLLAHSFPIHQMEDYLDEAGRTKMRYAHDESGKFIVNREAVEMREKLIHDIASIRVPEGPLEILLNHFGEKNVAEVTGRARRVIRVSTPEGEKTVIDNRSPSKALVDVQAFQDDKKKILVFSDAGGTGASYHADARAINKRKRIHYLLQAGWVADAAVQGFGRTHRSYQVQPPLYKLVCTNLKGQKRFISTIAKRLDQLGALTKGQRQTGSNGIYKYTDNLESMYAKAALRMFFEDLVYRRVKEFSVEEFEEETGLDLRNEDGNISDDTPPIHRFLNRILSLKITMQDLVFDAFSTRLEANVQRAMDAGTFDLGVETILADKVEKIAEQVVYTDERSGAITKHVELKLRFKNQPETYDDLTAGAGSAGGYGVQFFAKNSQSDHVYCFTYSSDRTETLGGKVMKMYRKIGPLDNERVERETIDSNPHWIKLTPKEARKAWAKTVKACPTYSEKTLHLITGAVLPIWDRFRGDPKVNRIRTDEGERLLGRVVMENDLGETLRNLGVTDDKYQAFDLKNILPRLIAGTHRYDLANGWTLKRSKLRGKYYVEIVGPDTRFEAELAQDGVTAIKVEYALRYFIAITDDATALVESVGGVIARRPIVASTQVASSPKPKGKAA